MKVLITGGAGYIGSHVAIKFLKENCQVSIIDNLENGCKSLVPKKAEFLIANITDEEKISKIIQKANFDIVIIAAYTKVGGLQKIQNIMKIIMKVQKNFYICVKNNLKNFIFLFNWIGLWKLSNKNF